MKPRKPKPLTAWAFTFTSKIYPGTFGLCVRASRENALSERRWLREPGVTLGPLTRIEVPKPEVKG